MWLDAIIVWILFFKPPVKIIWTIVLFFFKKQNFGWNEGFLMRDFFFHENSSGPPFGPPYWFLKSGISAFTEKKIDLLSHLEASEWKFCVKFSRFLGLQRGQRGLTLYILKNRQIFVKLPNLGCQISATIDPFELKIYQMREFPQFRSLVKF